jgi:hypothetical protein
MASGAFDMPVNPGSILKRCHRRDYNIFLRICVVRATLSLMPRISVVLDRETHKDAKRTALEANPPLTLMQYVANLVKEDLARRRKRDAA